MIHGGGRSLAISSSGGNRDGFANNSDGGLNAELLLLPPLVDAFDLCLLLLLLLLLLLDDVDAVTVEGLLIDLLLAATVVIDTLSDLDEVLMGCSMPKTNVKIFKRLRTKRH